MILTGKYKGRFLERFRVGDDCWEWQGALSDTGYGQIRVNRKTLYAHRISYEMFVGSIPDGLQVLHRCDNRKCVNPKHFFLGTKGDNVRDAGDKNRMPLGNLHWNVKIKDESVPKVFEMAKAGMTRLEIASYFKVSRAAVVDILLGRRRGKLLSKLGLAPLAREEIRRRMKE